MIRFEQVSKRYSGGIDALTDLTLSFESGEMAVLVGHSGAGKSTLLKLIPAIERPSHGAIIVNGQNVAALKRAAVPFLRRSIGMVFQDQKLLFDRSAFENVMLPLSIAGVSPRDAGKRVRAALDKVGLLEREKAMPIALSGGEQQRLAIARAVVCRPAILLADEPTAHLDPQTAQDVAGIFTEFHRVGVTTLIATHDNPLFTASNPRQLTLAQGRLTT